MKQAKTKKNRQVTKTEELQLTFREHFQELRKRLVYVALSIGLWSVITYIFERPTVNALLRPAQNQQFIYTSPIGGIDFMFRVSLYIALILSLPVIVYNALAFISPLLSSSSRKFIAFGSLASAVLAACGLAFGYFIGLPSAMHFLLHQFVTSQIKPLLTIQAYLSFVMVYMVGSALMLQIPLILIFINRIKPLKPKRLLHFERWVILGSFVMSAIMDPTPNVLDLLIVAGPLIIMYQVGIVIIAFLNRSSKTKRHQEFAPIAKSPPEEPELRPEPARQPQILRQFADIQNSRSNLRPVARPAQPTVRSRPTPPPSSRPKTMDIVPRRPLFNDQQIYHRRKLDGEAAA
jgi:sec-independent protein translocase protein TatC